MPYKLLFLLFVAILYSSQVQAVDIGADEWCSVSKFTDCLKISNDKCIESNKKSGSICLQKFPLEIEFENNKELYEAAENYGNCHINNFVILIDSSPNQFGFCSKHLEGLLSQSKIEAEKEKRRLDEEFFNTD